MAETIAVYFGCWNEAGHFLRGPGRRSLYDHEIRQMIIPTAADLDGSLLFLPRPEKTGAGCITYLPAIDRTILAWWGSPWDGRGAVNAAFITNGNAGEDAAWKLFCRYFPELAEKIERPTLITTNRK